MPSGGTFTSDLFEFVAMARHLKPKIAIPMHYNTFPMIMMDEEKLKQWAKEKLKDKVKVVILKQGESFYFKG